MSEEIESEVDGDAPVDEGVFPDPADAQSVHAPADVAELAEAVAHLPEFDESSESVATQNLSDDEESVSDEDFEHDIEDLAADDAEDPDAERLDAEDLGAEDDPDPEGSAEELSDEEGSEVEAAEGSVDVESEDSESEDSESDDSKSDDSESEDSEFDHSNAEEGEGEEEAPAGPTPDELMPDEELDRVVEALLFASGSALTPARIAKAAGGVSTRRVRRSIKRLRSEYEADLRAFDILEIGGGFRLYSRPEYEEYVARLERMRAPDRLSPTSLETLAIVAYRQPIIRAEVDAIRGVQSGPILRSLMERKLVRVVGRSDQPGRPLLYGTTKRFLDHFGLASVKDLPRVEDLKAP